MENNELNNGNKGWNNEEQREQWVEQWRTMKTKGGTMGGTIEQQVEHCRTMDGTMRIKPENTLKTYMTTY